MSKKKDELKKSTPAEPADEKEKDTQSAEEAVPEDGGNEAVREAELKCREAEKEAEALKAQAAELNDRYLRLLAEYDNFKKRTIKEKDDLYFLSKCDVLKKLLPVFDNLERAEKYTDNDQFAEGVKMIIKQFFEVLGTMEISEIPALDLPFDPEKHEAVFHDEKDGVPENTVTEVMQKGYMLGDRVLRHAMVKVSN